MNAERLQELRAEHRPGELTPEWCYFCETSVARWPCEQSAILDLALEAERRLHFWKECFDELAKINRGNAAEAERLRAQRDAALTDLKHEYGVVQRLRAQLDKHLIPPVSALTDTEDSNE